ncbi:MAG: DUF4173 domain-containing protein [Actinobacteria bacterium]|nr:DUF4173 domain-containing protein [Actinomycetota bacterium]
MTEADPTIPRPAVLVLAGAVTAVLLVGHPVGIGTFLSAAAVALAVAAQRPRAGEPPVLADTAVALLLAATATVTTAGWVLALVLTAAIGAAALAVAGGPSWAQLATAALAPVRAGWAAVRELSGSLGRRLGREAVRRSAPALRGAGIALVLVTVFGTLFVSADKAFAELTERYLVPDVRFDVLASRVVVGVLVSVGAAALTLAPSRGRSGPAAAAERHLGRSEWLTALVALDLLFASFVAVQITVLFGGHTHVLETSGLTYAEYARHGFFQLLVVAGLTLAVIAGAVRWSRRREDRDRRLLQVLLGILCLLTLVVLASALRRLGLYEQAFGFTRARMLAHATLLWFAVLFVIVMAAGARWDASWLPRATVVVTGIALLTFALLRPDGLIAEHNIARFEETGRIDLAYLDGLSTDAVPALAQLPPGMRSCVLADDAVRLRGDDRWHALNLSRQQARRVLVRIDGIDGPCRTS